MKKLRWLAALLLLGVALAQLSSQNVVQNTGSPTFTNLTVTGTCTGCGGSFYQTFQDHGTSQTQAATVNFRDAHATTGAIVDFDPTDSRIVWLQEEFSSGTAATTGTVGSLGWTRQTVGAAPTLSSNAGTWANPGQELLTSPAVVNQGGCIALDPNSLPLGPIGNNTSSFWTATWVFKMGETTGTGFYVGLLDGCIPTNTFGIRFDTASGDATNFQFVVNSTVNSTGVAIDTNFHTLTVYTDGATSGKLYLQLDGGTVQTACSSGCTFAVTPVTTGMSAGIGIVTRTAITSRTAVADFFAYKARINTNAANKRQ